MSKTQKSEPVRRRRVITNEAAPTISLSAQKERQKAEAKARFLFHLDECIGVVSYAALKAGIPRRTVYDWLEEDPEFQRSAKEVDHKQLDFVESKLLENIKTNDTRAITFYLSTKGRHRGYTTRVELTTPPDQPINTTVTVDHQEARAEMGDKAMAKALRAAMKANPGAFTDASRIAAFNGAVDSPTGP